jgi:hypothetical protein
VPGFVHEQGGKFARVRPCFFGKENDVAKDCANFICGNVSGVACGFQVSGEIAGEILLY